MVPPGEITVRTRSLIGSTVITSLLLVACALHQDDPAHAGSQPPSDDEAKEARQKAVAQLAPSSDADKRVESKTNSEVLLFRPLMLSRDSSGINEIFVSSSDSLSIKVVTRSDATSLRVTDPSGVDVGRSSPYPV